MSENSAKIANSLEMKVIFKNLLGLFRICIPQGVHSVMNLAKSHKNVLKIINLTWMLEMRWCWKISTKKNRHYLTTRDIGESTASNDISEHLKFTTFRDFARGPGPQTPAAIIPRLAWSVRLSSLGARKKMSRFWTQFCHENVTSWSMILPLTRPTTIKLPRYDLSQNTN